MADALKRPIALTDGLGVVMATQAVLGLVLAGKYRDAAWITASWFGNDAVTLVVATPLPVVAARRMSRGFMADLLRWLGAVGYAAVWCIPGEIAMWGTLAVFTAGATLLLLTNIRPCDSQA